MLNFDPQQVQTAISKGGTTLQTNAANLQLVATELLEECLRLNRENDALRAQDELKAMESKAVESHARAADRRAARAAKKSTGTKKS